MTELTIFNNDNFGQLRTTIIDGEPWFVAVDVCKALELDPTATRRLDEDEKNTLRLTQDIAGNPNVTVVNEPGLYSLVLGSRKPEAKAFKRWVTHEVLPSIRKNGLYITGQENMATSDFEQMVKGMQAMYRMIQSKNKAIEDKNKQIEQNNQTIAIQNQQIAEMKPKADYHDEILSCQNALPIRIIAKDYGKSAQWMNQFLAKHKIQYKQHGVWLLYQKYANEKYTKTETYYHYGYYGEKVAEVHTFWTQKGRLFLYDLLKKEGYLPKIEQNQYQHQCQPKDEEDPF